MKNEYSPEMIADVQEREKKALEYLKELQLSPAAQIIKINIGEGTGSDIFADKVTPYLRDLKYFNDEPKEGSVVSPIQKDDLVEEA